MIDIGAIDALCGIAMVVLGVASLLVRGDPS